MNFANCGCDISTVGGVKCNEHMEQWERDLLADLKNDEK